MDNTTQNGAPLTRRQAREIERRTGVRPVASAEPGSSFRREDTGRIERNEMTAILSVLPTELINQLSEPAAEAPRGLTVRAARPAALIAQRRRRTAGGFAAAASVTALAAVGLTSVAGQGAVVADTQHQADLLSAVNSQVSGATADAATQAAEEQQAEETAAAAAPAAESAEATEVESFDASAVASAAVAVPAPEPEATTTDASASASTSTGDSSAGATEASASAPSAPAPAATGNVQQTILAYAQSQVGTSGIDCTDFVQNALAAAGLTTSRFDGGYDYGPMGFAVFGTAIDPSQAQPGDLLLKEGHVGIYAGNGMAYHGGWNGKADVVAYTNVQADPYGYAMVIRVNG